MAHSGPVVAVPLPRGRHAAPRDAVEQSQRQRLLVAMAAVVADKGYADTAVADVLVRARVSRKSFYELFEHKLDCFLQSYDNSVTELMAAIDAALGGEHEPFAAAAAGIGSYLAFLAGNPAGARTFLVEVLGAGPAALARRAAVHERFVDQLQGVYELARQTFAQLPDLPRHRFRAVVGATDELVFEHVRVHGPADLPSLFAQVLDVQIALLLGHDVAARLREESADAGDTGGGSAAIDDA